MDDGKIIELYFARDERAIEETRLSYGRLLMSVAMSILHNAIDSEECESETYFRTWQAIPPTRPTYFSAFLTKITRNLAINRLHQNQSRAPLGPELIFEELAEAIPDTQGDITEDIELRDALNDFLEALDKTKRQIFVRRYFYMREVKQIAKEMGISAGSVKINLGRVRQELRLHLEQRGIVI